ncbi:TPA: 50S ribosomal protein L23 [bacterium]|nr:MAG: 50S ribosomal protein L23 [Candidatus Hydrogenedentes bacterium CG1_02_42_14]PIU47977.1 MAG: 50S ribosomal protein L23 [Candidatus Hydrogenedentes bacterium CG07_land_8_20_14_0_80_42_17]HBW47614.1 50S ribosomal protein L23 [bacterium]
MRTKSFKVIKAPIVTEKAREGWKDEIKGRLYSFEVDKSSTKAEIKSAVETAFEVKVAEVRTMTKCGKFRRRRMRGGYTAETKRAMVRLLPDYKIPFFDGI